MAEKFSTGLRNFMMAEGSFRKCFEDSVINIYDGAAPSSPDAAATGNLLLTLTKSSGAVSASERSTPKIYKVVIGSHGNGETFKFNVTVDGVGPTVYTYTNTPDLDLDGVTLQIAQMLNDIPQLDAIATSDVGDGEIFVKSRINGLDFTLSNEGSGTGTITSITENEAAVRSDALSFGPSSAGVISKTAAETWSGVVLRDGTAGYFRLVTSGDGAGLSTTDPRVQGTVASSGAELIARGSAVMELGATVTCNSFQVTFPES